MLNSNKIRWFYKKTPDAGIKSMGVRKQCADFRIELCFPHMLALPAYPSRHFTLLVNAVVSIVPEAEVGTRQKTGNMQDGLGRGFSGRSATDDPASITQDDVRHILRAEALTAFRFLNGEDAAFVLIVKGYKLACKSVCVRFILLVFE